MTNTTYNQTPIGLIPSEWEVKKLGEISKNKNSSLSINALLNNKGQFILYGASGILKTIDFYEEEANYISIIKDGAGVGRVFLCDKFSSVLGTMAYIKPFNDMVSLTYLYYLYQTIDFEKYITGSTIPHIYFSSYSIKKIPVPPLPEQQKIVAILSTWDVAIDNCKAIIEKLKVRNKGLAQQFLSGKIRVKGFEKTQWHLKSVEEVAVFKNGKAHENCIDEEGDYFVVNSKFISTQGKVAKASNENLCPLFKSDITMVMSDIPNGKALAKCFYIPEDNKYTLNQRICALTARKGINSKFLYYQMNRNNYYLAFNNGVSQTNLKKEEVLECPLLMPDVEEQIQIVKLIDTATEELKQYEQKLQTLQLQKKGLMQQLLTGKTRVKI